MMAVKMLIDAGAQCNATHVKGWSALHLAAACGHADILSVLNAHGGSIRAQTANSSTALHLAASQGHLKACEVLLALDTAAQLVYATDRHLATALHLAAAARAEPVVELLLRYGAARQSRDDQGRTPLEILLEKRGANPRLLRLLSSAEAVDELRAAEAPPAPGSPPSSPSPPPSQQTTPLGATVPRAHEAHTAEPQRATHADKLSAELDELRERVAALSNEAAAAAAACAGGVEAAKATEAVAAKWAEAAVAAMRAELDSLAPELRRAVGALGEAAEHADAASGRVDALEEVVRAEIGAARRGAAVLWAREAGRSARLSVAHFFSTCFLGWLLRGWACSCAGRGTMRRSSWLLSPDSA